MLILIIHKFAYIALIRNFGHIARTSTGIVNAFGPTSTVYVTHWLPLKNALKTSSVPGQTFNAPTRTRGRHHLLKSYTICNLTGLVWTLMHGQNCEYKRGIGMRHAMNQLESVWILDHLPLNPRFPLRFALHVWKKTKDRISKSNWQVWERFQIMFGVLFNIVQQSIGQNIAWNTDPKDFERKCIPKLWSMRGKNHCQMWMISNLPVIKQMLVLSLPWCCFGHVLPTVLQMLQDIGFLDWWMPREMSLWRNSPDTISFPLVRVVMLEWDGK